ncbi:MAG: orotate phosphoribosyltransferase [Deltaproteobacteria bacterium]|nr:orotate phosphoribosyltransferase [Deltaproteobacteria bacterium]
MNQNQRERLKELLLDLSCEQGEFTLSSGRKSNFYFDGKQTALNPEGAYLLGHLLFEKIREINLSVEAVGGPTLGADPLVTAVSLVSHLQQKPIPAFIIRKERKQHGTEAWVEGFRNLNPGMRVAIIEDVITTGKSSLEAVQKAIDAGLNVVCIVAIIDREEGGRQAIEEKGYRLETLFTKWELIGA